MRICNKSLNAKARNTCVFQPGFSHLLSLSLCLLACLCLFFRLDCWNCPVVRSAADMASANEAQPLVAPTAAASEEVGAVLSLHRFPALFFKIPPLFLCTHVRLCICVHVSFFVNLPKVIELLFTPPRWFLLFSLPFSRSASCLVFDFSLRLFVFCSCTHTRGHPRHTTSSHYVSLYHHAAPRNPALSTVCDVDGSDPDGSVHMRLHCPPLLPFFSVSPHKFLSLYILLCFFWLYVLRYPPPPPLPHRYCR